MRDNEDLRGIAGARSARSILAAVNGGLGGGKVKTRARRSGPIVFHDKPAYDRFKAAYPDVPASLVVNAAQNPAVEVKQKLLPTISACYKNEAKRSPGLSGKIGVIFEVGPDGKASKLAITEDTLGSPKVSMCISKLVQSHQFAPQEGITKVAFPFLFA